MSARMTATVPAEQLLRMYRTMLTIRCFEERAFRLVVEHKIASIHSSAGQEAVAAGICEALRSDDQIVSNHRGHGHCIAKGAELHAMMAELMGRDAGTNRGRGGSMHIADSDRGILGANGIVGAGIPIAVGAAYAAVVQRNGRVVAVFFGDGASSEGSCHEAMNLAALWKLPVVFVCEHNAYAEMTPTRVHVPVPDLVVRAQAYGMAGRQVDGNDALAVYETAREAVGHAREGQGPTLLECRTYRVRGHFEGDPERYKPEAEKAEWMQRDPIDRMARVLVAAGVAQAQIEQVSRDVEYEIERAVVFAQEAALPAPADVASFVYPST